MMEPLVQARGTPITPQRGEHPAPGDHVLPKQARGLRGAWMTRVLLVLLRLYQRTVSPDHGVLQPFFQGGVCRFTPTCSAYLSEALTTRGLSRGLLLGGKRLLRCHPFVSGGPDPVPQGERGT